MARDHELTAGRSDADRYFQVMEWLLISLLIFMPFAFGVVAAWSEQIMLSLCAALWAVFAAGLMRSARHRLLWHWAYVPILAFLLIAILQMVPLPTGLVRLLSPGTVAMRQQLFADTPELQSRLHSMPLSFYPWSTGHDFRIAFAVATVFFVVVNEYRNPARIKRLLATVSIVGGAVVLVCLAQSLLGNGRIYGFVPAGNGVANSGPFVNHSHFAQFVSLSMGAGLAWLLVQIEEDRRGKNVTAATLADYLKSRQGKGVAAATLLLTLGTTTVFLSLSRGGVISMLIAATFTTTVLSLRRARNHGWVVAAIVLVAFSCVLYIGFDAVYDRLATLENIHDAQGGRLQIIKDIVTAWARFPAWGSGLGTHAMVYPMFDHSAIAALASHAENEYAQLAEEMGILGLGALAAFGTLICASYVRIIRGAHQAVDFAAYGLGYGLLAILIHSLSDFGQHLPANAMLSAAFCALLVCLDRLNRPAEISHAGTASKPTQRTRHAQTALLVCGCVAWVWVLFRADQSRLAERHWAGVLRMEEQMVNADWQAPDAAYADLISRASRASGLEPGNIHYRHWLNVYRWRSISRTSDADGMVVLYDSAMESARRIAQDLREATFLCPTFGPTWCVLGQLEYSILNQKQHGLAHLRKSVTLSPNDPTVCLVAGLTDIECGHLQEGLAKLRKAVLLDGRVYPEVARTCVRDLRLPDTAIELADGQTHRLAQLAGILAQMDADETLTEGIEERITEALEAQCQDPQAPASCFAALGSIHERRRDTESAVLYFREALARDYGQVSYHLALARLLAHVGEIDGAMHEAKICLRLRPQYGPAERLVEELATRMTPSQTGL